MSIKVIATAEILDDGLFLGEIIGPTAFDTVVRSILVVVRPLEVYCTFDDCLWMRGCARCWRHVAKLFFLLISSQPEGVERRITHSFLLDPQGIHCEDL